MHIVKDVFQVLQGGCFELKKVLQMDISLSVMIVNFITDVKAKTFGLLWVSFPD